MPGVYIGNIFAVIFEMMLSLIKLTNNFQNLLECFIV
jgi:hypothetical protein